MEQEKNSAFYMRQMRARLREQGLVKREVWVLPEHKAALTAIEKQLRQPIKAGDTLKEIGMGLPELWNTSRLFEALNALDMFKGEEASITLIEGAEPSVRILMHEFGDLPIFIAVVGEQIIVESLLWQQSDVSNVSLFNDQVLRSRQLFPLSSIGIETLPDGQVVYTMFGSLSAGSSLSNVVTEIEVLATNVIRATEAYENLLNAA